MGWDKGGRYGELEQKIKEYLEVARGRGDKEDVATAIIFLTVLRNGCRLSEAMEALYRHARGWAGREVTVRIRKREGSEYRVIVIPPEIRGRDLKMYLEWLSTWIKGDYTEEELEDEVRLKEFYEKLHKASKWLYRNPLNLNTTTLRWAWVRHQLGKGVHPKVIMEVTGLRRLDHILTKNVNKEELLG